MQMTRKIHVNKDRTVLLAPKNGEYAGVLAERIVNEFIRAVAVLESTSGYSNDGDVRNAEKFLEFAKKAMNPSDEGISLTEAVPLSVISTVTASFAELGLMEYIVLDSYNEGKAIHGSITLSYRPNPDEPKKINKVRVTGVIPIFLIEAIREVYEALKETMLLIDQSIGSLGAAAKELVKSADSAASKKVEQPAKPAVVKSTPDLGTYSKNTDNDTMEIFKKLPPDQQQLVCDLTMRFLSDSVLALHARLSKAMTVKKS